MKKTDIVKIAKQHEIKTAKLTKRELILAIQGAEGNAVCYAATDGSCAEYGCAWREDCFVEAGCKDALGRNEAEAPQVADGSSNEKPLPAY